MMSKHYRHCHLQVTILRTSVWRSPLATGVVCVCFVLCFVAFRLWVRWFVWFLYFPVGCLGLLFIRSWPQIGRFS